MWRCPLRVLFVFSNAFTKTKGRLFRLVVRTLPFHGKDMGSIPIKDSGSIAQLVEHLLCKQGVSSSILDVSFKISFIGNVCKYNIVEILHKIFEIR